MIKSKLVRLVTQILILIFLLILALIGCDFFVFPDYEIKVYNPYDRPVSVGIIGSEMKTIDPYKSELFILKQHANNYAYLYAEGAYFSSYRAELHHLSKYGNSHTLSANQGWYCLKNRSNNTIELAYFNNDPFYFDENFNTISAGITPPGSDIFLQVTEKTGVFGQITFRVDLKKYKILTLNQFPEIGKTREIYLWSSTPVEEISPY